LKLVETNSDALEKERGRLILKVTELMKIFGSIVEKSK